MILIKAVMQRNEDKEPCVHVAYEIKSSLISQQHLFLCGGVVGYVVVVIISPHLNEEKYEN